MKGAKNLMKMVGSVTKTFARPIKKEHIMNTDMTSLYYYTGIAHDGSDTISLFQ